jgi:predicted Rossmann-fold nucleotide-binding protein
VRTEIESLDEFDHHVAAGQPLTQCVLKDIDLRERSAVLERAELTRAVFLGCLLTPESLAAVQRSRALVFPPIEGIPFDPYRAHLYTVDDLYGGFDPNEPDGYRHTLDARIDDWARASEPGDVLDALTQRLHDHAITEAVADLIEGERVAGVMGGHDLRRDDPMYRAVAGIGRELQRAGLLVATGGGPGAMEAANLGAFCGPHPDGVLDDAIAVLSSAPRYDQRDEWLAAGLSARSRWLVGCGRSLGIPTWHYGHEPPTPFATHIAKYFQNSVREDGLLTIADAGIVYTPGASGTLQELFQDGSQNCYAAPGQASPMVLFGVDFWTHTISAEKPLRQLAVGTAAEHLITLTDDPTEVVAAILTPTK